MSELEIVVSGEELKKKLNLKDGKPGPKGDKGDSIVGPPGKPGKPGKNGSPDSPEDILKKIDGKVSYRNLKDKPDIAAIARKVMPNVASRDYDLAELKDVLITTPINNQILKYNGTKWVNGTDEGGLVDSVNGQTGTVVLDAGDVGAQEPITLTTTGTSGLATFAGNTLNIPNYSTAPGGSDTQVQFNDGGTFGGDSGLLYNKTTNSLTTDQVIVKSGGSSSSLALKFGTLDTGFYAPTTGTDRIEVVVNGGNPMDILSTHLAVAGALASTFSAGLTVSGGSLTVGSLSGVLKASAGVVSGSATTADLPDSLNKRYVTDADLVDIGNLSGVNTGDQTSIVGITGTKAQFDTAVTDGNFLYVGDVTQYTDELAQDAVGAMVDSSLVYVDATPLLSRAALTGAITASQGSNTTALGSFTKAQLDTAVSDGNVLYTDAIGVSVQAYDADLTTWAGLTPSANAQSLVTAANYAAMRALLDLEAGTDFYSIAGADAAFQPKDADLTTIAGLTATTDNFIVSVSSAWASRTPAQVRTTLGLVIGTNVQAWDADLDSWAGVTRASGFDTFVATPSSANLRSLLTDETGTGSAVFSDSPTFTGTLAAAALTTSGNATLGDAAGDTHVVNGALRFAQNVSFPGAASGNAYMYHSQTLGLVQYGEGTSYDFLNNNKSGGTVYGIPTGTTILLLFGALQFNTLPGNYASDALAAAGGIAVGQVYRNGSALQIRVT